MRYADRSHFVVVVDERRKSVSGASIEWNLHDYEVTEWDLPDDVHVLDIAYTFLLLASDFVPGAVTRFVVQAVNELRKEMDKENDDLPF